jgi:hypothetical protein
MDVDDFAGGGRVVMMALFVLRPSEDDGHLTHFPPST